MKIKNNSGFTLAELLIVIGIFGILTALVSSAVSSSPDKAHDTNIKNNIRQLQLQLLAEIEFSQSESYLNWTSGVDDPNAITVLQNNIIEHYGSGTGALIQEGQVDNHCISAPLKSGGFYCIDADKEYVITTAACSAHACP